MKNYAIAALAAVPCIVAVAPAATVEEYTAILDEQLAAMKEVVTILASAKDKESADAAAAQVKEIMQKAEASGAKAEALGEPTPEQQAQLQAILMERQGEINGVIQGLVPVVFGLMQNDCYGSDAMKAILEEMGGSAMPVEEEEIDVEEDDVDEEA